MEKHLRSDALASYEVIAVDVSLSGVSLSGGLCGGPFGLVKEAFGQGWCTEAHEKERRRHSASRSRNGPRLHTSGFIRLQTVQGLKYQKTLNLRFDGAHLRELREPRGCMHSAKRVAAWLTLGLDRCVRLGWHFCMKLDLLHNADP